jgi:glutathione gamma-glutamylcysteinyltransferase
MEKPSKQSHVVNANPSFYRRPLPPDLIALTSPLGKEIFREALLEGNAENYFPLVGNFTTQTEPAYCGLGSLVMVLNSLEVDPGRNWKGVWRWYSDEMLDCCAPLEVIKQTGITFDEFKCLATCNGLNVAAYRPDQSSYEEFLQAIQRVSNSEDEHLVVSFCRKTLKQSGDGHFSPIGAYNAKREMALVLDVARFKYPSYWVSTRLLYEALKPIDSVTKKSRGYFLLKMKPVVNSQPFFKWFATIPFADVVAYINGDYIRKLREFVKSTENVCLSDVFGHFFDHVQCEMTDLKFSNITEGVDLVGPGLTDEFNADLDSIIKQLARHPIYPMCVSLNNLNENPLFSDSDVVDPYALASFTI